MGLNAEAKAIYERLQDDESRELFVCRYNYFQTGNHDGLWDQVIITTRFHKNKSILSGNTLKHVMNFIETDAAFGDGVVLYGAGIYIAKVIGQLTNNNVKVDAICDSSPQKQEKKILNREILAPERIINEYNKLPVIITAGNPVFKKDIYEFLTKNGIPKTKIFFHYDLMEEQYFNLPFLPAIPNEIYVDAGCYDGKTIRDFFKFAGEGTVYGFEPDSRSYVKTVEFLRKHQIQNVKMFQKGLWNKSEVLNFDDTGDGRSKVSEKGSVTIETIRLDDVLSPDYKATFIKMDIEGAELKGLYGAKNTIAKSLPRLAVCIYHKRDDVITIPSFILSISSKYVFYIRHHNLWGPAETVLYAIPK